MKTMVIAALGLLIVSAGMGIWTAISGAPYNTALLTVHKLTSIGFAVLCVIWFIGEVRQTGMGTGDIVLAAVFVAALIALLATGGMMSAKPQPAALLRIIHTAAAAVLSLSAGWKLIAFLIG